jgi:hypothetical protein
MTDPRMTDPLHEATRAVGELEAALAKKAPFDRYLARTVLVSVGELALAERADEASALAKRVREAAAPREKEWREAVTFELRLAASEHIQAIDLRHLNNPRYDFEYTVTARERLEARLRAAELFGEELPEDLLDGVQKADAILAPFLRARDGGEPLN